MRCCGGLGRDIYRWHSDLYICTGIAYAKKMGKTPEEYGRFVGELFAPSWEDTREKKPGPEYFAKFYYSHMSAYPDFEMDVLEVDSDSVRFKHNRPYRSYFENEDMFGVTIDEYEAFMKASNEPISGYLNMNIELELDGDWMVVTMTRKQ